jgi:hypothetical protein
LRDPSGRSDDGIRDLLVGPGGLKPTEHSTQAEKLPVKPDRVPADRPEPSTLATNALVEDVVLDLVKLVGKASAGLGLRCHDSLDNDIEQLHRGQDAATFHGGIAGDVQSENRMPSTAREQARAHDEMQATAGVDSKAFARSPGRDRPRRRRYGPPRR